MTQLIVPLGGGLFDTGPNFVFNMGGGPGVRVHQFGGNRPRRRPHNHADGPPPSPLSALQSLLPLLLLIIVPLLSSLFSGSSSVSSGPSMVFEQPRPPHTLQHLSNRLKINYYVDPQEVQEYTAKKWRDLDKVAEVKYVNSLNYECDVEHDRRNRLVNDAQGFFFTDQTKMDQARRMEMRSCRRLNDLGVGYRRV